MSESVPESVPELPVHRAIGAVARALYRHDRRMTQPIVQVDGFADAPFGGNPAAVCVQTTVRDERWMQHVAREMNLSETAFLAACRDRDEGYDSRWFTPTHEVDVCGHATLASAHVLGDGRARGRRRRAIPHAQRAPDRDPTGRVDRARFSGDAGYRG